MLFASMSGRFEVVRELMKHRANVDAQDEKV
ncbi:MAG: ankyrin repeat domain-containing protein [Bryobacteraceae bacterium]|nr:ankyrin repeat domain-containing protein [Bryobacteraceae bacterium]